MGHLNRCAEIARALRASGGTPYFLVRTEDTEEVTSFLAKRKLFESAQFIAPDVPAIDDARRTAKMYGDIGAEMLLVDHYRSALKYQEVLEDAGCRWTQFDYRRSGPLRAHIVVNADPSASKEEYQPLVASHTRLLLGPDYGVIREELKDMSISLPDGQGNAVDILMLFGAGDAKGGFEKVSDLLRDAARGEEVQMHWATTSANPNYRKLAELASQADDVSLYLDTTLLALLMRHATFAVTAGGSTTFELAFFEKPMLIVPIAENQYRLAKAWEKKGVAQATPPLRELESISMETIAALRNQAAKKYQSQSLVDGKGAERIVKELSQHVNVSISNEVEKV